MTTNSSAKWAAMIGFLVFVAQRAAKASSIEQSVLLTFPAVRCSYKLIYQLLSAPSELLVRLQRHLLLVLTHTLLASVSILLISTASFPP